jgi:hypothetical protein
MPKSKGRKKGAGQRYQLAPDRRSKSKASPRWYGPLLIGLMAVGVIVIVLNYIGLMPGTNDQADPLWLWVGLGLIGVGFIGTTFWH